MLKNIANTPGAAIALAVAGWAGPIAMAQSIQGTVLDPDSGIAPKAQVMLTQDYNKRVVRDATISAGGSVAGPVVISSPDPESDVVSAASVMTWRYRPMNLNAHPVESQVRITLQFCLR